jgi:SAM-dependent methyltransferase
MNSKFDHWQKIYEKSEIEFSWYQSYPDTSVRLITEANVSLDEPVIDIGGGDSHLADALLQLGYSNIHVLDISERAIERAKVRLGKFSDKIKWIVSDIVHFKPREIFAVWHDRATFHFLIDDSNVQSYRESLAKSMKENGRFILGAFSENGPMKCSGLPIRQYSETMMLKTFADDFKKEYCFEEVHQTPFKTKQSFQFCIFSKQ